MVSRRYPEAGMGTSDTATYPGSRPSDGGNTSTPAMSVYDRDTVQWCSLSCISGCSWEAKVDEGLSHRAALRLVNEK